VFDSVECPNKRVRHSSRLGCCHFDLAHIAVLGAAQLCSFGWTARRSGSAGRLGRPASQRPVGITAPRDADRVGRGHRILDDRSFNGTVVNGRSFPAPGRRGSSDAPLGSVGFPLSDGTIRRRRSRFDGRRGRAAQPRLRSHGYPSGVRSHLSSRRPPRGPARTALQSRRQLA
jgi:hypothetical protein